jgi:hypothetical protein
LLRVGKEDVISCLSPGVVSKKIVKEWASGLLTGTMTIALPCALVNWHHPDHQCILASDPWVKNTFATLSIDHTFCSAPAAISHHPNNVWYIGIAWSGPWRLQDKNQARFVIEQRPVVPQRPLDHHTTCCWHMDMMR